MTVFDLNIIELIWNSTAQRLRQVINFAWLKCLCAPILYLQGLFNTNRLNNLYYCNHNSQVCYLNGVLNDNFDFTDRTIYISNPTYIDPVTVWLTTETQPLGIELLLPLYTDAEMSPIALYTEAETGVNLDCFIVNVPTVLGLTADQLTQLTELVNKYRLPSKYSWSINLV